MTMLYGGFKNVNIRIVQVNENQHIQTPPEEASKGRTGDPALRDIDDLVKRGVLVKEPGGGRSTSHALADRWTR
jgi:hypothetical protein